MLSVLIQILDDLQKVTDEDIARALRSLRPVQDGERAIGTVGGSELRSMWALQFIYNGRSLEAIHRAEFRSSTEAERAELTAESGRYREMTQSCRALFWTETTSEIGGEAWSVGNLGLRENFTVCCADSKAASQSSYSQQPGQEPLQ